MTPLTPRDPESNRAAEEQGINTVDEQHLKALHKENMRRNLRIIGLGLAAYYFISAGFSWWEEHQAEKNGPAQVQSQPDIATAIHTGLGSTGLTPGALQRNSANFTILFREDLKISGRFGDQGQLTEITLSSGAADPDLCQKAATVIVQALEGSAQLMQDLRSPDGSSGPVVVRSGKYEYTATWQDPQVRLLVRSF